MIRVADSMAILVETAVRGETGVRVRLVMQARYVFVCCASGGVVRVHSFTPGYLRQFERVYTADSTDENGYAP